MKKKYIVLVNGLKAKETATAHKAAKIATKLANKGLSTSYAQKLPNIQAQGNMNVFKFLNGGK